MEKFMEMDRNIIKGGRLILSAIFVMLISISMAQGASEKISARSAYIMDSQSGKVIYAKNPDLRQAPASTTKLITAMVALDKLDLDEVVSVSYRAANIYPSHKRLRKGDKYTVRSLLNLALMSSVNSAAVALAEAAGGSEAVFVLMMNKKAESIGAENTNFINSSGLPGSGQYITAKDLAMIMDAALKYPQIREIIHTKVKEVKAVKGLNISAINTNKLLWSDEDVLGGKTGYTNVAMHCLAFAVKKDDSTLVAAVLGDSKRSCLWRSAKQLVSKVGMNENGEDVIENTIEQSNPDDSSKFISKTRYMSKKSHIKKIYSKKSHHKAKIYAKNKGKKPIKARIAKKDSKTTIKKAQLKQVSLNEIAYNRE
jgi:D-alanyl-D-alanine carboxypeptidase (penicillin-binding protein 5/6)